MSLSPEGLEQFAVLHDVVCVCFCDEGSGRCKLLSGEIDKAAKLGGGGVRYVHVHVDAHPSASVIYGVDEVPSVRFFVRGRMVGEYDGRRMAADIAAAAREHVERVEAARGAGAGQTWSFTDLDADTFRAASHNHTLNLFVMFYSRSCQACTHLMRDYEAVARTFAPLSDLSIARLDADAFPSAAHPYTKHGIPAFVFFGQADRFFGLKPLAVTYADFRVAAAMVRFLNRKCGRKQKLVTVKGMLAIPEGMEDEMEKEGGDVDAPGWVFQPAGGGQ